jgi:hypothetical protein
MTLASPGKERTSDDDQREWTGMKPEVGCVALANRHKSEFAEMIGG